MPAFLLATVCLKPDPLQGNTLLHLEVESIIKNVWSHDIQGDRSCNATQSRQIYSRQSILLDLYPA
jgi:hypothetical protein